MRRAVAPLLLLAAFLALVAPHALQAQPAPVRRVGLLGVGASESSPFFDALRQGLRERGWVEGQNIAFEDRTAVGHYSRLPEVAAELVRLKVDVIVTSGTTAALAARKATGTIPIVTTAGGDPVETGLAASLARPGGNITGITSMGRELVGKRLEVLKEAIPGISRIAVFWFPDSRTEGLQVKNSEAAAKGLGLQVRSVEVRRFEDVEKVFAGLVRDRVEALAPPSSVLLRAHRARIVELAARHRLPTIFDDRAYVETGGLMSYGADIRAIFRQLAGYVDRILKGARAGDLPIEQANKVELVINAKTARALGLTIPSSVMLRADQVIE
jgi:putative ABC transport system substrate-binding protein